MESLQRIIDPLKNTRLGIATTYGKPYFKFVKSLKRTNLKFDTIFPEEIPFYEGNLVFTTASEAPQNTNKPMMFEEVFDKHPTIVRGLLIHKLELGYQNDFLILGIDPGKRIGLSIFYCGKEIESSFHTSEEKLVSHVISILAELKSKRKIVKVGNGNIEMAKKIANLLNLGFCSSFELEFVDEKRTSRKIKNFNQRGKRDSLSAKYISKREGDRKFVLPLSITG